MRKPFAIQIAVFAVVIALAGVSCTVRSGKERELQATVEALQTQAASQPVSIPTRPPEPTATRSPKPTPTPSSEPTPAVQVIESLMIQCRENWVSSQLVDKWWAAWIVEYPPGYWGKVEGQILLEGAGGTIVGQVDTWFYPGEGGIGWIGPEKLESGGSKVANVRLDSVQPSFERASDSVNAYEGKWNISVVGHYVDHICFYGYCLEVDNPSYPSHVLLVEVLNSSDVAMKNVRVFALVRNSQGELQDMVDSSDDLVLVGDNVDALRPLDIPYGKSATVIAQSKSPMGDCPGAADSNGYSADIFVTFEAFDGQRITRYFPNWRLP